MTAASPQSGSNQDPENLLRFLLAMAAVDGGLTRQEMNLLADRADDLGISPEDFARLIDEATEGHGTPDIPKTAEKQFELLAELVRMMGADGKIHDNERQFFALIAMRLNLSVAEVNRAIDAAMHQGP